MNYAAFAILIIISLVACKPKAITVPQVVTVPGVVVESEPISLEAIWRNDSIVLIDSSKAVVVIKRDTVRRTVQVRAECPDVQVQKEVQVLEVVKERKVIDWWLVLAMASIIAVIMANLLKRFV